MKKVLLFFVVASLFSLGSLAQLVPSTKRVCNERCLKLKFEANPETIRHEARMQDLAARKKAETDPEKVKALAEEEELELDKRSIFLEKSCKHICSANPDD